MSQHVDKLRKHLAEVMDEGTSSISESLSISATNESFGGDPEEIDLAMSGLEHLQADSEIFEDEAFALEAIVLPRQRPVVDIVGNKFRRPARPWRHLRDEPNKGRIEAAIPSVGRVEIPNHPSRPYGGTAFVVGDGLLMTNRHVAETFAFGVGLRQLHFIPGRQPGIDFKQEVIPEDKPVVLDFDSVMMIHPFWDCALIKVGGLDPARKAIALEGREPDGLDREVVVIGYPGQDTRNDVALQNRIFRGQFQIKRLQPGRLKTRATVNSFGNMVEALTHDCSTLGGNSGSLVLDIKTGRAVGLHFAGIYLEANYAVPAWELARDARVVDAGVKFEDRVDDGTELPWEDVWLRADPEREIGPPSDQTPGQAPAVRTPSRTETPLLGDDWFERIDDALLQEAIARDGEGTHLRLAGVLGETEADEVMADLAEAGEMQEGLFTPEPDPDLPEIIYLHGIMGSHLANRNGAGSRVWFNFKAFAKGNVAEKMLLKADGLTDDHPRLTLGADGHLRTIYSKATRRWRNQRFVVHEFSFDWRKPIHTSADRLHDFIERLAAEKRDRRFAIVAHSMGGLVSSIYAQRHPIWADRIQRAVFVGSPLGGSYAPIEAVLGVYPFFKTLANLSRHDNIPDLQALAPTLPGLMEMMPNPRLFDDPVDYFTRAPWPAGPKPSQRWLDRSRHIKSEILGSPLLARTTGIVSREHATVGGVSVDAAGHLAAGPRTRPGDGTVPIQASAVAELSEVYEGNGLPRHSNLLKSGRVIQGAADLLRSGATDRLDRLAIDDIDLSATIAEPESAEITEAMTGGIERRLDRGSLTGADVEWLLDPLSGPPPQ